MHFIKHETAGITEGSKFIMLRNAHVNDIEEMNKLVNHFAKKT